jgi:hypothetical protein
MRRIVTANFAAVLLGVALLAQEAAAQERATDVSASASALFERGLEAMQRRDLARGCPLLAESARLDPRPGALFTAAECEFSWGKFGSADAHYQDFLAHFARMSPDQRTAQETRAVIAARMRAELAPRVPKLALELAPGAPPGTRVRRDGVELGSAALGVALPVDPGEHDVTVTAPDGREATRKVAVREGKTERISLTLPAAVAHPGAGAGASGASGLRTLGWAALGVGVVGLGVGSVFGLTAIGKAETVEQHCVGAVCDRDGRTAADEAKSAATVSTVAFVAGGVALAAGSALLLFAPAKGASALAISDGSSGALVVRGRF